MKKLSLLLVLLSTASLTSFGQKLGIKAGVTFPTIASKSDYILEDAPNAVDYQSGTSYYAGATIAFNVTPAFAIQSGLSFIGKGAAIKTDGSNFSGKTKLYYLELPINAIYSVQTKAGKIFFGGGPYYAYGISGKYKFEFDTTSPNSSDQEVNISFGKDKDYKSGDFGLNFLAGFELNNRLNIQAGYGLGLSSITKKSITHFSERNRVISVGLGYSFK